ncbi:MAG: hypothetical protein J5I53_07075, partial [Bradyrhizobiaceae bacterium]|nr:hypothetical protein [Bradyrhizobiaceae bacterium]
MSRPLLVNPTMKVPSRRHFLCKGTIRAGIVTWLALCACLACSTQVFATPDGPALHENWRTVWPALSIGPRYVVEGNDAQHVIVFGALGISSLNPTTGEQEWTKEIKLFDEDGIFMLRSRPEFVLFGSITDRDLYPGLESHRGWIQVRSYPDGEVVRTILMPGG